MKSLLFILICFHSAFSNCQTIRLHEEEKEISSVIFNHHSFNSKKFKIEIKQFYGNRLADQSVLKYMIHDDSTIEVRETRRNQIFRIKDSVFIPINQKNQNVNQEDLYFFSHSNYLRRSILTYYTDYFYSGDTVTYIKDDLESTSLNSSDILVEGIDTINVGLQVILKKKNNEISLVRNLFQNGNWYPWYDLIISTTQNGNLGWETTIKGKKFRVEYIDHGTEGEINELHKTLIEYDKKGLIKSIVIKKMDLISGHLDTTILKIN